MIRPATVADARAIAELEVRAWRWAYVDIVAEQDMITVEEREAHWSAGALEGAFVAEVEGRVVGVVQVGPRRADDAPAVGLRCRGPADVEPAAQGAGIGGGALRARGRAAAGRGLRRGRPLALRRPTATRAASTSVAAGRRRRDRHAPRRRAALSADSRAMTSNAAVAAVAHPGHVDAIRPVAAGDVHAIAALQVRAWRAEYAGFVDEDHMPTLDDRIGLWNGVRPGEAWLAEREGEIIGVVGVANGEIGVLHVDPDDRPRRRGRRPAAHPRRGDLARRRPHDRAAVDLPRERAQPRALRAPRLGARRHRAGDAARRLRDPLPVGPVGPSCWWPVTDHASSAIRQRVAGALDARPEIIARVARAVAAGRIGDEPPPGATGARGSVYVRDLIDRSLVFICRRDGAELIVITLWEQEGGIAAPRVPQRFTNALKRDDERRREE